MMKFNHIILISVKALLFIKPQLRTIQIETPLDKPDSVEINLKQTKAKAKFKSQLKSMLMRILN